MRRPELPVHLTSFIGRQTELAELSPLLAQQRLVTLTGPGGVGKTRLAMEVARGVANNFADGVCVVELAPLADARLVPQAVAAVSGVREQSGRTLMATLSEAMSARQLLLVLDNCEHLMDACAALTSHLLRDCPELRILATSREALGIAGETAWLVPGLSLPDLRAPTHEQLEASEAVQLFVARAQAASRGFALTDENSPALVRVCHRLDGIPLALELAAARARQLTVEQIGARLDDHFALLSTTSRSVPARHQTIRATVEWSYALLDEPEQRLFEGLSVFSGGWTLEAAEAVCQPTDSGGSVLDGIGRLVDKSLVATDLSRSEARYRQLEMLRHSAADRLRARGGDRVIRRRHSDYFLGLLERAEEALTGSAQASWLDLLEREHDNLRAAMGWSLESGEIDLGLRLAWVMWRFWWVRGYLSEGRRRTADLLSLARPAGASALLARGLVCSGLLAMWQADYPAATSHLVDALTMARPFGDRQAMAYALAFLTRVRRDQGDEDHARVLGTEAVELFRTLDDRWGLAIALHFLGLAHEAADTSTARQLFNESASVFRELGNAWDRAMPLRGLGDVEYLEGDAARAETFYQQSASLFQQRGDDWSVAMLRTQLGYAALAQRNAGGAARLFMQSLDSWQKLGHRRGTVLCLAGLSAIVMDRGHLIEAARLLGATEAACEQYAVGLEPIAQATFYVRLQRVRRQLGEASFSTAWREGRELELDDALSTALTASGARDRGQPSRDQLSARERDVARLIAAGLTNRQVGEQLVISERTVDRHVENMLKKLGCATRTQIAAWATETMGTAGAPSPG